MKVNFKGKIWRVTLLLLCGFLVLFVFRFIYGYTSKFKIRENNYISDFFEEGMTKRNYASSDYSVKKGGKDYDMAAPAETQGSNNNSQEVSIEQKYEKTAVVKSKSDAFETDKKSFKMA